MSQVPSVVTMVEKQKKNQIRYNIYIDGSFSFAIHEDVMIKYRIFKGTELNREQMEEILHEDEKQQAYAQALRYLGRKPRTGFEIRERLKQKGFEPELIEIVILSLKDQNYVNDADFARMWSEHRIHGQKKGRRLVRQELEQKGVGKDIILETVGQIKEEDEYCHAFHLGTKKWNSTSGDLMQRKRKTASFLLRRGYPAGIVQRVVREVAGGAEELEEFH